ncbi:uncharacterized protein [Panulirus ornatus]|uniref:uncharacterized protein isoform X2 n=1 Tax=Panulirus ornatus TaxID=150431 RepID=UPI003A87A416
MAQAQQEHERGLCSSHGQLLCYWCRQCAKLLCGHCILEEHLKQGHEVLHATEFIQEKKEAIHERVQQLRTVFGESRGWVMTCLHRCLVNLVWLCQESNNICDLDAQLLQIASEAENLKDVESVLVSETKLRSLQQEEDKSPTQGCTVGEEGVTVGNGEPAGGGDEEEEAPDAGGGDAADGDVSSETGPPAGGAADEGTGNDGTAGGGGGGDVPNSSSACGKAVTDDFAAGDETNLKVAAAGDTADAKASSSGGRGAWWWPLTSCVVSGDGRQAEVERGDHCLLVYALRHSPIDAHLGIQLSMLECLVDQESPVVFLELSAGRQYLGRIVIRLWGRLRRAQHFKALCLATLGPSYVGSRFEYVGNRDQPGEYIVTGGYMTQEPCWMLEGAKLETRSTRGLMENLEWGGEFVGEEREGLLQGAGGGHPEYDSLFCICSRSDPAGESQCPFGEVMSGMEVVRMAVSHDPVSEVAISRCGLLIHDA